MVLQTYITRCFLNGIQCSRYENHTYCLNFNKDSVLPTLFGFLFLFYQIFSTFTFQMLSQKSPIPSPALLANQPTPTSWSWHFPVLGHIIFRRPRASPPNEGKLVHLLLYMQLETHALGGTGQFILLLLLQGCQPLQLLGYFLQLLYWGPCVPSNR